MSIGKRAILYIKRNKSRNFLLFTVMVLCLTAGLIALEMRIKAEAVSEKMQESFSGFFSIEPEADEPESSKRLTDQFCKEVMGQVENILAYNGKDMYLLAVSDLQLIEGKYTGADEEKASITKFVVNSSTQYSELFSLGELNLIKGEHLVPDDKGKVLISESLASKNNLDVGDSIESAVTEACLVPNPDALGKTFTYQIKGIYQVKYPADNNHDTMESEIAENCIFVDSYTGKTVNSLLRGEEMNWYRLGVAFFVKDTDKIEETLNAVKKVGQLSDHAYQVELNNAKYEKTAAPFHSLMKTVDIFLTILIVTAVMAMSIILVLHMRSRKREIAIYLSIGLEKKQVCLQLLLENILVFIISYVTASILSIIGSEIIVASLLSGTYQDMLERGIGIAGFVGGLAGGLLVLLFSVIAPASMIVKSHPLDILSDE